MDPSIHGTNRSSKSEYVSPEGLDESVAGASPKQVPVYLDVQSQASVGSEDEAFLCPPSSNSPSPPRLKSSVPQNEKNMWFATTFSSAAVLNAIRNLMKIIMEGRMDMVPLKCTTIQQTYQCGTAVAECVRKEHEQEAMRHRLQMVTSIVQAVSAGLDIMSTIRAPGKAQEYAESQERGGVKLKELRKTKQDELDTHIRGTATDQQNPNFVADPVITKKLKDELQGIDKEIGKEKMSYMETENAMIRSRGQLITSLASTVEHALQAAIDSAKGEIGKEKALLESLRELLRKWDDLARDFSQQSNDMVRGQVELFNSFSSGFAHQANPRG